MQIDVGNGLHAHKIVSEDNTMYILENVQQNDGGRAAAAAAESVPVATASQNTASKHTNGARWGDVGGARAGTGANSGAATVRPSTTVADSSRSFIIPTTSGDTTVRATSPPASAVLTALAIQRLRAHRSAGAARGTAPGVTLGEQSDSEGSLSFGSDDSDGDSGLQEAAVVAITDDDSGLQEAAVVAITGAVGSYPILTAPTTSAAVVPAGNLGNSFNDNGGIGGIGGGSSLSSNAGAGAAGLASHGNGDAWADESEDAQLAWALAESSRTDEDAEMAMRGWDDDDDSQLARARADNVEAARHDEAVEVVDEVEAGSNHNEVVTGGRGGTPAVSPTTATYDVPSSQRVQDVEKRSDSESSSSDEGEAAPMVAFAAPPSVTNISKDHPDSSSLASSAPPLYHHSITVAGGTTSASIPPITDPNAAATATTGTTNRIGNPSPPIDPTATDTTIDIDSNATASPIPVPAISLPAFTADYLETKMVGEEETISPPSASDERVASDSDDSDDSEASELVEVDVPLHQPVQRGIDAPLLDGTVASDFGGGSSAVADAVAADVAAASADDVLDDDDNDDDDDDAVEGVVAGTDHDADDDASKHNAPKKTIFLPPTPQQPIVAGIANATLGTAVGRDAARAVLEADENELEGSARKAAAAAAGVTTQQILEVQEMLRLFGLPFVTAPMEAEAQCAALEQDGHTVGTITDDSDIFLFGGRTVYRRMCSSKKGAEVYRAGDIEKQLLLDRSRLIRLAYLLGCDYTAGITGVGKGHVLIPALVEGLVLPLPVH
jgi:hypothetical protein